MRKGGKKGGGGSSDAFHTNDFGSRNSAVFFLKEGRGGRGRPKTHKEYFSKALTIEDEENKLNISASVVISPKCPVNLLGRDLMTRLGIAIIPIKDGMRACRVRDADVYASCPDENSVYC